jgi:hypothetical protein
LSGCIVSLRRTQVFNANIAKTAKLAARSRVSLSVIQDNTPSPTNAAIANPKRVTAITGAQGRIRTFVPRKEGQIYSLLALTTHPPVQTSGPSRPQTANPGTTDHQFLRVEEDVCLQAKPNRTTRRAKTLARENTTLGKFLMECRWEKSSYATAPRKITCSGNQIFFVNQMLELAKGFEPPTL